MSESFIRLFRVLQLVPRAPRSIDTATLESILVQEGFSGVRRTLQRDLVKLERMGLGLECLSDSKPYRWRFIDGAQLPSSLDRAGGLGRVGQGTRAGRRMGLSLRVDHVAHPVLLQAPIGASQRIVKRRDGEHVLEAEVHDSPHLRRQIVALGAHVEVLSPLSLRKAVAEIHRAAWARYAERAG